jgi:hypothetical protein
MRNRLATVTETTRKAPHMTADHGRGSTNESDRNQRDSRAASEKPEKYRFADNLPDDGETAAEREYEDYVLAERDSDSEEPDVLLDAPVVKVDEISLKVEELQALVSLQADVLNLLRLHVGAKVWIGQVGLEIKGVEAQALLKVRLANVTRILDRVLTTIDRNPQLLEGLVEGAGKAVGELGEGAGSAVEDVGEGAGSAVEDVGEGAGSAVEDVGEGAGSAVEDVGEGAGSAVEDVGEGAGSAVEDVGEGAGSAVEDVGEGAGSTVEDVGEGAGEAVEDTGDTARSTAQAAGRTAGKAAEGAGRTAKQATGRAQAQEGGAAKQRRQTRASEGAKRTSRESSGRAPDSKRRER